MERKKLFGGALVAALVVVVGVVVAFLAAEKSHMASAQNVQKPVMVQDEPHTELKKEPVTEVAEVAEEEPEEDTEEPAPAPTTAPTTAPATPAGDQTLSYGEYWSYGDGLLETISEEMQEYDNEKIVSDLQNSGATMSGDMILACVSTENYVGEDGATYQRTSYIWRNTINNTTSTTEEVTLIAAAPAPATLTMQVTASEVAATDVGSGATTASEGAYAPAPQSEEVAEPVPAPAEEQGSFDVPSPGTIEEYTTEAGETFNIIW